MERKYSSALHPRRSRCLAANRQALAIDPVHVQKSKKVFPGEEFYREDMPSAELVSAQHGSVGTFLMLQPSELYQIQFSRRTVMKLLSKRLYSMETSGRVAS